MIMSDDNGNRMDKQPGLLRMCPECTGVVSEILCKFLIRPEFEALPAEYPISNKEYPAEQDKKVRGANGKTFGAPF